MKKLFSSALSAIKKSTMLVALFSMSIVANAATYALYGNVPEGATDLTANVSAQALGSATFVDGVFTGAGLPDRICEFTNYLQMSFLAQQTMDLSENFAIHIVVAKAAGAVGDLQLAFCNNGWNAARLGYVIPNASINETATDIVLNYKDYSPNNWNSFEQSKFIGTPATFGAAEFLRVCAANAEAFTISSIYLTDAADVTPEPEPEDSIVTPEPEFDGETRYYFFSSRETLPVAEELLSVDLRDGKGTTIQWNNAMKGVDPAVTTYSAIAVSNGWFSFNQNLTSATDMSALATGGYLVIKMRSNLDVTKKLNVRLCNNVSYVLDADDVATFDNNWHVLTFDLKDAQNNPVFNNAMNGTIFQLHSDGMGEGKIDIDFAYLTNDITNIDEGTANDSTVTPEPEPEVIPEQSAQRIYLRKGTAVTPAGVAETADYTATTSVSSEWWNCTPSDTFFGVATQENWWFNFQLKSSTDVDLTPVYSTWKLVISVKNGVVEEGQDRGLTINLAGANLNLVSTFAQATAFTQHVLPLADVLTGANNLKLLSAGTTVIDFSSGNNNVAGRNVEFDYIYLTNETDVPAVPTSIDIVESQLNAQKVVRNGQVYILRGGQMFDVTGRQVQ